MGAVSRPLEVVVGQGQLAKHVTECTELSLAHQGITQLAGFERLVNLEVLWIDHNQLLAVDNLDKNIRIKQLFAHNNRICTLKGSLLRLKCLTHLDLSNNQLRNLAKLLRTLNKMRFLQELNLQGNPCCEEPGYRLMVVNAIPTLQVLDHHQVTTLERLKASVAVGGDTTQGVAPSSIAFGSRVPQSAVKVGSKGRSELEMEIDQAAAGVRAQRQQAADAAEQALYQSNPYADYWAPHSVLPPPPGMIQAQQAWNERATDCSKCSFGAPMCSSLVCSSTAVGVETAPHKAVVCTQSGTGAVKPGPGVAESGVASTEVTADMSYIPKDVMIIHRLQRISDTYDGHQPSSDSSTSAHAGKWNYFGGTFRQHLTKKQWQVTDSRHRL